MSSLIKTNNLSRIYHQGSSKINAVQNINFELKEKEKIVIYGRSGSGKSTLLNLLCGIEKFSDGEIFYKNTPYKNDHKKLTKIRRENMGFVYQFHFLLNEFTAAENVSLGAMIFGTNKKDSILKAKEILDKFGLVSRLNHFPGQLSGGEKQRVAMARALINKPDVVFLDEPTGNLDNDTAKEVINFLDSSVEESNASVVVATHDPEFRSFGDKILTMDSGIFV